MATVRRKTRPFSLTRLRCAVVPLALATAATTGCATAPQPMVEPAFAARTYTPSRIALLPPDVFLVLDQVGANDPATSAALSQAFTNETADAIGRQLRARGYDVDLSARWDGIVGGDGSVLVSRDQLGWLANGIVEFENSPEGASQGPAVPARFVAPELAARVGWATRSDALLYLNVKGVTVSSGKRAAQIAGVVFFVVIVAAIIVAALASSKGGGGGGRGLGGGASGGGWRGGTPVFRGTPPGASAGGLVGAAPRPSAGWRAPIGRGVPPPAPLGGGRVYGGGPRLGVGVGVVIPIDGPQYTHDGTVAYDDPAFAGDDMYLAMTLVSAYDGRILWHVRQHLDVDAESPKDVDAMVQAMLGPLPARAGTPGPAAAATAPPPASATR